MVSFNKIKNSAAAALAALLGILAFAACQDDVVVPGGSTADVPTTISLDITLPEAEHVSRASLGDAELNTVRSLWVGIYSATTGKCTFKGMMDKEHGFDPSKPFVGGSHSTRATLTNIDTRSGSSYIVAVANPQGNVGTVLDGSIPASTEETMSEAPYVARDLVELLDEATTWDKFLAISIKSDNAALGAETLGAQPPIPAGGIPMSGVYIPRGESLDHCWENAQPVDITPETDNLSGAIHLRRAWSKVSFDVSVDGDLITFEPYQYRILNIPVYTWLYERAQGSSGKAIDQANAGDVINTRALGNPAFVNTPLYNINDFTRETTGGVTHYKFDFWSPENKRTATAMCTDYGKREVEYTRLENPRLNTGIYQSLCPDRAGDVNNNATMVEIYANVVYKTKTGDAINGQGTDYEVLLDSLTTNNTRVATVKYTVHLGYVDNDAKDFNLRRNTEYTYNVKAKGVFDIIVEAFKVGIPQPGQEGTVSDVEYVPEELDCHFTQFNVYLNQDEINTFTYDIVTYDAGREYRYYVYRDLNNRKPDQEAEITEQHLPESDQERTDYFNWVQLRFVGPGTENAHKFAAYHPDEVVSLDEVGKDEKAMNEGYYTVFVREYSYEGTGDETGGRWKDYVNQPDRQVHIYVRTARSGDTESLYFSSKYNAVQKSIQTYYNLDYLNQNKTAIGIEQVNESFGMNLRWVYGWTGSGSSIRNTTAQALENKNNGREIMWNYMGTKTNGRQWSTYVDLASQQHINAITASATYYPNLNNLISRDARYHNVAALKEITPYLTSRTSESVKGYWVLAKASGYDPQSDASTAQYVDILTTCINRNRDENGNGTIDINEMKWYVPTSGKLLRIIVGHRALPVPLMSFPARIASYGYGSNSLDYDGPYKMVTADFKMLWMDEGTSFSTLWDGTQPKSYVFSAWEVRCVRDLGTNLNQQAEQVHPAYIHDADLNYIVPRYYKLNSFRPYTDQPLPANFPNQVESNIAEFGFEYYDETGFTGQNPTGLGSAKGSYSGLVTWIQNNQGCSALNASTGKTGWRVPNQKELTAMFVVDRSLFLGSTAYFVSSTFDAYTGGNLNATPSRMVMCTHNNPTCVAFSNATLLRCVRDLTREESLKAVESASASN